MFPSINCFCQVPKQTLTWKSNLDYVDMISFDVILYINALCMPYFQLSVNMPAGAPDGIRSPTLTAVNSSAIRAVWGPPERINAPDSPGVLYQLQFRQTTQDVENIYDENTGMQLTCPSFFQSENRYCTNLVQMIDF